eukprot:117192_1
MAATSLLHNEVSRKIHVGAYNETIIPFCIILTISLIIVSICVYVASHDADDTTGYYLIFPWICVLFLWNIMEAYIVHSTKYYSNIKTQRSYTITSVSLFIFAVCYIPSGDVGLESLLFGVPFNIFLYEFFAIQHFHSISWTFIINKGCNCNLRCCFITARFILLPVWIILLGSWYVGSLFGSEYYDDLLLTIWIFTMLGLVIYAFLLNCILFYSLIQYTTYVSSIFISKNVESTFSEEKYKDYVKRKENHSCRATIYFSLVLIICTLALYMTFALFDPNRKVGTIYFLHIIKIIMELQLLTLTLYFHKPSFTKHRKCSQCNMYYLEQQQCNICGEGDVELRFNSREHSISDKKLKTTVDNTQVPIAVTAPKQFDNFSVECCDDNIAECPHFGRISELSLTGILDREYIETMNNIESNYDRLAMLNDFIHVINDHDIDKINHLVAECKCDEYDYNRRGAAMRNKISNDDYMMSLISNIHCYLYHNINHISQLSRINNLQKFGDNSTMEDDRKHIDEDNDTIQETEDVLSYGFGSFIYYNLLTPPKFKCFKEEMMDIITINEWNAIYEACAQLLMSEYAKRIIARNNHTNLLKIQPIQIGDVLAIKFYTDFDEEQYKFRKSFRKVCKNDTTKDIINRHISKYYFWGKWLNHAISVYGSKMNNKHEAATYYHGLSGKFIFSSSRNDFNIPTSVTLSLLAAQHFAGFDGIILQLKCQWDFKSKWNLSKSLSVDWISSFADEKEVLLFGNFNQLIISNIYLMDDLDHNNEHKLMMEAINNFEQLCDGYVFDKSTDMQQYVNIMQAFIENEINNTLIDYFSKLFHNICINRRVFCSTAFVLDHVQCANMFRTICDKYNVKKVCNLCSSEMQRIMINDTSISVDKQCWEWECNKNSQFYCSNNLCVVHGLCNECMNILSLLQTIFGNAVHSNEKIPRLNPEKYNALRIEVLQSKKLF